MLTTTQPVVASNLLLILAADVPAALYLAEGVIDGAKVLMLNPEQDGVAQITAALQQYPGISSLHIVAHGGPGRLALGNQNLDTAQLSDHAAQLQQWSDYLGKD
ncbi:MAG TPA: DUF4347 domain-containing protein, partial [Allocoleopsis sp.]